MAIETILLRIATTVATVGGRTLIAGRRSTAERRMTLVELAGARGLGLLPQRRLNRQLEQLAETIADRLQPVVDAELASMPAAERQLVLDGVAETLETTEFTDDVLLATDLDESALVTLAEPAAGPVLARLGLGDAGEAFFRRMLREAVAHLAEVIVTLPSFHQRTLRELLARDTEIIELLRRVLDQMPRQGRAGRSAEAEFEVDYRREVARKLDRVELFGVTVAGPTRRYSLNVAYIGLSLAAHGDRQTGDEVGLDQVVSATRRVYLRGEAGSGKTTLLRWLALKIVRGEHVGLLAPWNRIVPMMVELRRFAERDLPGPAGLLAGLSRSLVERTPEGWADHLLRTGRAALLIDGVDEFPADRRDELYRWIDDLVHDYPQARIVVTSRPAATTADWLAGPAFTPADLMPMSRPHIAAFLRHWHAAIATELGGQTTEDEVTGYRRAMTTALDRSRPLRMMATNPLLCALLCALNWDRRTQLPQRRIEIYRAALEMLLRRRDHERQLSARLDIGLEYDDRLSILQDLAYWFTITGLTDAEEARVRARVAAIIENMPHVRVGAAAVYDYLLTRSGVLREAVPGRIDFIHKTFQEYLAAVRFVEDDALDGLVRDAGRDEFQEVIVMAAGCARQHEAERLVTALLELAERPRISRVRRARLRLLAVSCSEVVTRMSREVSDRVLAHLRELVPPVSPGSARILAGLGEDILPMLPDGGRRLPEREAAASIYTAALIGGPAALRHIVTFSADPRPAVSRERMKAWSSFDAVEFARTAFGARAEGWPISVREPGLLPGLPFVRDLGRVRCELGEDATATAIDVLSRVEQLESLLLRRNREVVSLDFLPAGTALGTLVIELCANLRSARALARCVGLRTLVVRDCPAEIGDDLLNPLIELRNLAVESVGIDVEDLAARHPHLSRLELTDIESGLDTTERLGPGRALSHLTLAWCEDLRGLGGLGALPLRTLEIIGCHNLTGLDGVGEAAGLRSLTVVDVPHLDDGDFLARLPGLEQLTLANCGIADLSALHPDAKLRELVLVSNDTVPGSDVLLGLAHLRRVEIVGLVDHLGPDAEHYIGTLRRAGIEVVTDDEGGTGLRDPDEVDDEEWLDPDELAAISGYEDFVPLQRRMARVRRLGRSELVL